MEAEQRNRKNKNLRFGELSKLILRHKHDLWYNSNEFSIKFKKYLKAEKQKNLQKALEVYQKMLATILIVLHTFISAGLIWIVLVEMTKFSELGGAFGSGAAYTMFGRKRGLDTSGKITVVLAVAFFAMCFLTSWVLSK